MQLLDPSALARIRTLPCCWCGRPGPSQCHHNTVRRGIGGNQTIDHPCNLVPLCLDHHDGHHFRNRPSRYDLERLVAAREGVSVEKVRETVLAIRRAVK